MIISMYYHDKRPCAFNDLAVLFHQMASLPGNKGKFLINLVNFNLVNADFSFDFLKFTQISRTPSDPKQKFIIEVLNSIRFSDFAPFLSIMGDHFFEFALRMLHYHGY